MAKERRGELDPARDLQDRILENFLCRLASSDHIPSTVVDCFQKLVADGSICDVNQVEAAMLSEGEPNGENPTT